MGVNPDDRSDNQNHIDDTITPKKKPNLNPGDPTTSTRPIYHSSPPHEFSVLTAASESDLRYDRNNFYRSNKQDPNYEIENFPSYYLRQVRLYSLFGLVLLILMCVTFVVVGNYFPAIIFFLLTTALALSAIYGVHYRDWRLILGVFMLSFVLSAYLAVCGVLAIVQTVSRASMSDTDLISIGFRSRGLAIAAGVARVLLCFLHAIYWGIVGYYSEKTTRILLEDSLQFNSELRRGVSIQHRSPNAADQQFDNSPNIIQVVGNPVYSSPNELHSSINIINVPSVPPLINSNIKASNKGQPTCISTEGLPVNTNSAQQTPEQYIESPHQLTFERLPPNPHSG